MYVIDYSFEIKIKMQFFSSFCYHYFVPFHLVRSFEKSEEIAKYSLMLNVKINGIAKIYFCETWCFMIFLAFSLSIGVIGWCISKAVVFLNPSYLSSELDESSKQNWCNLKKEAMHSSKWFQKLIKHNDLARTLFVCYIKTKNIITIVIFSNIIAWHIKVISFLYRKCVNIIFMFIKIC